MNPGKNILIAKEQGNTSQGRNGRQKEQEK